MPLTNRVNPYSHIFATSDRGDFMGNRGCLHDEHKQLTGRRWTTNAWIICALDFRGRKREVMSRDGYTELFFLDEATALAAGHRPCGECRNAAYKRFKAAFVAAQGEAGREVVSAADMDRVIHRERTREPKRVAPIASLPDGVTVDLDGEAWLKSGGEIRRWTSAGYDELRPTSDAEAPVLTPPSIVSVLAAGYPVALHGSAVR